jgi:hypothetical protein
MRVSFIPFEAMTIREKAEHLVVVHGMGVDYHDGSDGDEVIFDSDQDVIDWYAGWAEPHSMLYFVHEDDHDYLAEDEHLPATLAGSHTHTKEV